MFDLSQIPDEASALVSVFRANGHGGEFLATLAVDPDPIFLTPVWKCVRVDVDALDDFPGLNRFLFEFLGTLVPIFPFARHSSSETARIASRNQLMPITRRSGSSKALMVFPHKGSAGKSFQATWLCRCQ